MKSLLFFMLSLLNSFIAFPQTKTDSITGFRNSYWGRSAAVIQASENAEFMQQSKGFGSSVLSYKGEISGLPARIDYTFKNDSLIEGSYSIEKIDSFFNRMADIRDFLSGFYGKPDYVNINAIDPDSAWTVENPGILYNGPQYFWEFKNGFICQYSSKFFPSNDKEEITITVLYVPELKISEYSQTRLIPLDELNFPKELWDGANP